MNSVLPVILLIVACAVAGIILISLTSFFPAFYRRVEKNDAQPEDYQLTPKTVEFTSLDHIPLKAWVISPDLNPGQSPQGVIVLLHGMANMDASSMLGQAAMFTKMGYYSIALDMRAHGRSGGKRIGLAIEEPRDVIPVLDWVKNQPEYKSLPVVLYGISLGGATAIRTAAKRQDVSAVISISSFATIDLLINDQFSTSGSIKFLSGIFLFFTQVFIWALYREWAAKASPLQDIASIPPRPIFIIHGRADQSISIDHAKLLAKAGEASVKSWYPENAGYGVVKGNGTGTEDKEFRNHIANFLKTLAK